jgi:hypothetical protein
MNEADRQHLESIARRHGIDFFDHTMALSLAARAGRNEILCAAASFALIDGDGNKGLYLDPDDANTPEEAYFIGLHEVAHTLLGHHTNDKDNVSNEIEAWEWTLNHAQYWPSDDAICKILDSLSTYTDGYEAEQRPESLLAIVTDPDLWVKYKWSLTLLNVRIGFARQEDTKTVMLGDPPNERILDIGFAQMVADYIHYAKEYQEETFLRNMKRMFNDPDLVARVPEPAKKLVDELLRDANKNLDKDLAKYDEPKPDKTAGK